MYIYYVTTYMQFIYLIAQKRPTLKCALYYAADLKCVACIEYGRSKVEKM